MIAMPRVTIGLVPLLLPALAGCTPPTPAGLWAAPGSVTASTWALRSLQGRTIPRSRHEAVTLRLSPDHGVTGTASCNDVDGRELTWAAATDSEGTFARDPAQPTIMTVVGCNDVAATQTAGRFWELMTGAREWSIDCGDLVIRFDDGSTALLKPIGPASRRSADCGHADPNNFDCPRVAGAGAKAIAIDGDKWHR